MSNGTEGEDTTHDERALRRKIRRATEPLDYSPSSGPVGSEQKRYDASAPQTTEGGEGARTTFYPEEGDNNHDYEKLAKINRGHFANGDDKQRREARRREDLQIFTNFVDFDPLKKERASQILDRIDDVRPFQNDEVLLLSIITLVANEDDERIQYDDDFQQLRDICNVSKKQIRQSRTKLRKKL